MSHSTKVLALKSRQLDYKTAEVSQSLSKVSEQLKASYGLRSKLTELWNKTSAEAQVTLKKTPASELPHGTKIEPQSNPETLQAPQEKKPLVSDLARQFSAIRESVNALTSDITSQRQQQHALSEILVTLGKQEKKVSELIQQNQKPELDESDENQITLEPQTFEFESKLQPEPELELQYGQLNPDPQFLGTSAELKQTVETTSAVPEPPRFTTQQSTAGLNVDLVFSDPKLGQIGINLIQAANQPVQIYCSLDDSRLRAKLRERLNKSFAQSEFGGSKVNISVGRNR